MFQRVALTFYDTANVRSATGADKETTLPASIVKSHIFPFLGVEVERASVGVVMVFEGKKR